MNHWLDQIAIISALTTAVAYFNHRTLQLPRSMALMAGALTLSMLILLTNHLGVWSWAIQAKHQLNAWPFEQLVLQGMLGFLLYAGSIHLNIKHMKNLKGEICTLAIISTLFSSLGCACLLYYVLGWMNHPISWLSALFFGTLISPTDPIAVLSALKRLKAPPSIAAKLAGESLFNDAVGVVLFTTLLNLAHQQTSISWLGVVYVFVLQAGGGLLWGVLLGRLSVVCLKRIHDPALSVLLTVSVVTVGYPLAAHFGVSGPLAMVVAGMFVSQLHSSDHLGRRCKESILVFWEVVDELLNAILFLLLGLELLWVDVTFQDLSLIAITIPLLLFVRYITVQLPLALSPKRRMFHPATVKVLVWGGLRGGLAVALALAVPTELSRHTLLVLTYGVVIFSVLIQGGTISYLIPSESSSHENE